LNLAKEITSMRRFNLSATRLSRRSLRRVACLGIALAALLAVPGPAAAQSGLMTRVDGSAAGGGVFDGAVSLRSFQVQGNRLFAVGTLDGKLTDAAGETVGEVRDLAVRLPLQAGSLSASCDLLAARLGPTGVSAGGTEIELAAVELEIAARAGGAALRELLCDVSKRLDAGESPQSLAAELDRVLGAL
jgi:hypothetical protein